MKLPSNDERFLELLPSWGTPYSYGAGSPADAHAGWPDGVKGNGGGKGYDCSGYVQAALVHFGMLSETAPDRSAAALYAAGSPIPAGGELFGDLAFYGAGYRVSHVMLVVGPGVVMGSRGGGEGTNGNDPRAFVQIEPLHYWSLFMGVRRLPAEVGS